MSTESRNYKEGFVSMTRTKLKTEPERKWVCPICKEEVHKDDHVILLINNHKYFPNCIIHEGCYSEEDHVNVFWKIERLANMLKEVKDVF